MKNKCKEELISNINDEVESIDPCLTDMCCVDKFLDILEEDTLELILGNLKRIEERYQYKQ